MPDLELRLYEPGDETGIVDLFNEVFPVTTTLEDWHWKNGDNPAGFPLIAVALDGPRIIGHACLNPVLVSVQGEVVKAAQGVDMMVAREYRGEGLIAQLDRLLVERNSQTDYAAFSFGFPVPRFEPFTRTAMGYEEASSPYQWGRPLNWAYPFRSLLRDRPLLLEHSRRLGAILSRRLPQAKVGLTVRRIDRFDESFDLLWDSLVPHLGIAVVRDRQYLSWRYAHPDFATYAHYGPEGMDGFIVLRTTGWEGWRVGNVADLLALDAKVAYRLLSAAGAHFKAEGVDMIRCWTMTTPPYRQALRRLGFIRRRSPNKLMVRSHSLAPPASLLQEPDRWYLTLGDSDGV